VPEVLDRELQLIREGIALVASGRAPRTIVAGLRLSEALLDPASRLATQAHVALTPLWRTDDSGLDIAIERLPA
jgi:hypothetical protein